MRNLIGMLIGAAIDKGDGDSGIKGAIIGSVAQGAVRIATPLAIAFAVGWGVLHLARRVAAKAVDAVGPEPSARDIQVS